MSLFSGLFLSTTICKRCVKQVTSSSPVYTGPISRWSYRIKPPWTIYSNSARTKRGAGGSKSPRESHQATKSDCVCNSVSKSSIGVILNIGDHIILSLGATRSSGVLPSKVGCFSSNRPEARPTVENLSSSVHIESVISSLSKDSVI